eukprot:scaffold9426_cov90-Isochrysis_galbana.AAC.4
MAVAQRTAAAPRSDAMPWPSHLTAMPSYSVCARAWHCGGAMTAESDVRIGSSVAGGSTGTVASKTGEDGAEAPVLSAAAGTTAPTLGYSMRLVATKRGSAPSIAPAGACLDSRLASVSAARWRTAMRACRAPTSAWPSDTGEKADNMSTTTASTPSMAMMTGSGLPPLRGAGRIADGRRCYAPQIDGSSGWRAAATTRTSGIAASRPPRGLGPLT